MIPAVQQLASADGAVGAAVVGFYQAMLPLLPSLMQMATSAIPMITDALVVVLPLLTRMFQLLTDGANIVVPRWAPRSTCWRRRSPGLEHHQDALKLLGTQ
jgi:hypothetical protein